MVADDGEAGEGFGAVEEVAEGVVGLVDFAADVLGDAEHFGVEVADPGHLHVVPVVHGVEDEGCAFDDAAVDAFALVLGDDAKYNAVAVRSGATFEFDPGTDHLPDAKLAVEVFEDLVHVGDHDEEGDGLFVVVAEPRQFWGEDGLELFHDGEGLFLAHLFEVGVVAPGFVVDMPEVGCELADLFLVDVAEGVAGVLHELGVLFLKTGGHG